jgi:hypothetical protein
VMFSLVLIYLGIQVFSNVSVECSAPVWAGNVSEECSAPVWAGNVSEECSAPVWAGNLSEECSAPVWAGMCAGVSRKCVETNGGV